MNALGSQILAAGRYHAGKTAPYFQAILYGLAPVSAPQIPTVAVTRHGVLMVNYDTVATWTKEECAGVLVHECMHVLLDHIKRCEEAGRIPELDNIASDMTINPGIWDMGLQLPGGPSGKRPTKGEFHCVYPEEYGFARGLTTDEYYDLLRKHPNVKIVAVEGGGAGQGKCGSCAGEPAKDEPGPNNKASRSAGEMHRIAVQVAEETRNHAANSGRGTVPAFMQRWAEAMLQPPEVPWQKELAAVARFACAWAATAVDHRYDAPSRRQAGIGFGPGRPILPRLRCPVPRVAVVFDTSGSMGDSELGEAGRELDGILKAVGADVTFVTCDADVHGVSQVQTLRDALGRLKGGGGTDMQPAIAALMNHKPKPDIIIIATDLMIGHPGPEPKNTKVIWLGVGNYAGAAPDPPWGRTIRTNKAKNNGKR